MVHRNGAVPEVRDRALDGVRDGGVFQGSRVHENAAGQRAPDALVAELDRVIDVFPAAEKDMVRSMLSESLQAVISQTLLKRPGGGRVAAHEIMIGTSAIRNLIREDKVARCTLRFRLVPRLECRRWISV